MGRLTKGREAITILGETVLAVAMQVGCKRLVKSGEGCKWLGVFRSITWLTYYRVCCYHEGQGKHHKRRDVERWLSDGS